MLQPSIQRTGPTTEALARRIRHAHSQDHQLTFGMPVTVIIWMFDESNPTQIILYPREDGRLRLTDNAEAICAEDGWEDYDTGFFELDPAKIHLLLNAQQSEPNAVPQAITFSIWHTSDRDSLDVELQGVKAPSEIILYPLEDRRLRMVDHITINDPEEWEDTFFSHIISPATLPPHRQDLTPGRSHGSLTSVGITRYMTVCADCRTHRTSSTERRGTAEPCAKTEPSPEIHGNVPTKLTKCYLFQVALNGKSDADLVKGENYQIVDMRVFTSGRIIKIVSYDVACQYTKKIVPYVGLLSQHLGEMAGIEIDSVVSEIPELVEV
ncbi:hypothetical protein C8J57DRAFT_1255973 [Mycena rebaudengoi]|nr:hypothetical protein C8J57DRAFT_1255973 [Mycena rebaudengoi]